MRLLNTETKRLETFYGEKIPKYAILSHMWGREEDEVLFNHIVGSDADRREGESREGYAKVEGACRQAMEDGWKYIWIDTCCIDKTSSAELSEAINSMYEWYENSVVCYVYLEDVGSDRELDSDGDGEHNSDKGKEIDGDEVKDYYNWKFDKEEDNSNEDGGPGKFPIVPFERSRWFSRGWTLQELIAPRFVVFYSKDWIDIGTKASLQDAISAVTRIRVELLTDYQLQKVSVAEKMSWAAFRKTTRAEDAAYCLMGLLGVNMPLLYGEGERAFIRLQEELMKVSDDDSLFAWKFRFDGYDNYTGGMLAASPWDFRDGMNIARSVDGAYSQYSMTNKGLKIKLPLLPIDPNLKCHLTDPESVFKAVLKCSIREKTPTRWIVIYLKKIKGHYQRIFPHWLDETEAPPSETKLISLLVPQAPFKTRHHLIISGFRIEILPTESGFTFDGHSLVEGYKHTIDHYAMIPFKHQEKHFGVAIGWDGYPWLDFIDVVDEAQSYDPFKYDPGGPRAHLRKRHLDRLSEKIPGADWSVTVTVMRTSYDLDRLLAVIAIQREPVRAKMWYNPPANSNSDAFSGKFPLKYQNVHSEFKKEAHNWMATYNPKVERKLDVSLVYTLALKSTVYCLQFSSDGKYLATGSNDNMLRVYDTKMGDEICTFLLNESTSIKLGCICFSPDSKFIAVGNSWEGYIKIWDIDAKCVHKTLNGHQSSIESLCFSPNGHLLISGSIDGTVLIWWIADWASRILTIPPGYTQSASIKSIAISPDGSLMAIGDFGGIVRIWDMVTTQLLEEFPKHGKSVYVAFTPDGKGLVSGSTDRVPSKYWDISGLVRTGVKGKSDNLSDSGASSALQVATRRDVLGNLRQPIMTFIGHKRLLVSSVGVSHDGRWVVSRVRSGQVLFLDARNMTLQLVLETSIRGFSVLCDLSSVGNMLATTSGNKNETVQVWRYDYIEPQGYPSSSHVST